MNLQIAPLLGQDPELTLKIVTPPKVEKKKKKKKNPDSGKDGRQEQKE